MLCALCARARARPCGCAVARTTACAGRLSASEMAAKFVVPADDNDAYATLVTGAAAATLCVVGESRPC